MRITRKENGDVVFKISGELNAANIVALKVSLAGEASNRIVFELSDLISADAEAVKFLEKCESEAIELKECNTYFRERIRRERAATKARKR